MPVFSNLSTVRRSIDANDKAMSKAIREATPMVARYTRDTIRKRVPPGNTSTSGMSNPFPGYAATGDLKRNIVAGPVRSTGVSGGYESKVGIAANASRLTRIKAVVHEYGKVIKPRRAPYLVFKVPPSGGQRVNSGQVGDRYDLGPTRDGGWRRAKRVRIRAKRFFRSGWYEASQRFGTIFADHITQRWPPKG